METIASPTLLELQRLIAKVPRYPLSINQLLKLAKDNNASVQFRSFYKKFNNDQTFDSEDDLLARTEQIEILRRDEKDMPIENPLIPIED